MPRRVPIRITANDKTEYARLVKNTRAKINRTQKNYGIDLSNQINIPSLENIKTRKEYNEIVEKMNSFTNRANTYFQFKKNDYGVVASKHDIWEFEQNKKRANRKARREIKKIEDLPMYNDGQQTEETVGQAMKKMQRPSPAGISEIKDTKFEEFRSQDSFKKATMKAKKKSEPKYYDKRKETMKANYIKALEKAFNSDAQKLASDINKMSANEFFEMYMQSGDTFDFRLFYVADEYVQPEEEEVEGMQTFYEKFIRGDYNQDLKGF
jgi:hypothetical protein